MNLKITIEVGDYSYQGEYKHFKPLHKEFVEITPIGIDFEKEAIILTRMSLKKLKERILCGTSTIR